MIQLLKLINVLTIMIIVSLDTYCGYQIIVHPTFNHWYWNVPTLPYL